MSDFRFVILGAGLIAHRFCDAVRRVPGCVVTAVASKSLEKAEAFARETGVPAAYDSYERALEAERPDCAYIATTCDSHYSLSMLCIERGVPVLCEKAMFTCADEAQRCFAAAGQRGVFAMEALWTRYLPTILTAREWVRSGRIGDPVLCEMGVGFVAPRDADNRYLSPALGGGATNDITVYGYQLLPWVTDREVIRYRAEAVPAFTGVDETEIVVLRLEGGLLGVIKTSFAAPVEERMVICGTRGRIVVPQAHMCKEAFLYGPGGELEEHFVDDVTENGFTYEIEDVVRCVREGRLESDVVPQSSTLACARLFDYVRSEMTP